MPGSISIRQSLLRSILLVIALLSGGFLATTFFASRQTVQALSTATMNQALDHTLSRLTGFVDPVRSQLRAAGAWVDAGLLAPDDPEGARRLLAPLLRETPQLGAALIADDVGREVLLLRSGAAWTLRVRDPGTRGGQARLLTWNDSGGSPREQWLDSAYDPRTRPWFRGAVAAGGSVHWTEPYVFHSTGQPGVTAALARGDAGARQVVAFDVELGALTRFTRGLELTPRARVFVVDERARVLGLPADPRFEDAAARSAALLERPEALGIPAVRDALLAFERGPVPLGQPFAYRSGPERWWGLGQGFALGGGREWRVGVVIPEADLRGNVDEVRLAIVLLTLAVLGIALLQTLRHAMRLSQPIELLVAQSERIGRGILEPGQPIVSRVEEVRRLAGAQEHMREALGVLLRVERDLQLARQIQRSALPERLPSLPGFAIAAWSEPAEQTGGDCYDVIGLSEGGGSDFATDVAERALCMLADAAGHGVGPALSVTQVRSMVRVAARGGEGVLRIAELLNGQLSADLPPGRFVTAWLGELDARTGRLRSLSAGQAPLLHFRAGTGSVESLPADAPPLGVLPSLEIEVRPPLELDPGDVFAVVSDGVLDAAGADGALFGAERVAELLARFANEGPDRILAELRAALETFTAGAPADDDRTALILQRR